MNCVNHPEAAVSAWCQNCGKPLCAECVRNDQGNVFCEQCLAARAPVSPAAYPPGAAPPTGANPGLATLLGFIPGVGAMYNGQYIKAIVHVLVFVVLVGLSGHANGLFGILVAFWVIYQVFDAHQTAKARRDGLPLPDPFGLNDLGSAFGAHPGPRPVPPPTPPPPGTVPPPPYSGWAEQVRTQAQGWGQQAGEWGEQLRQRIVAEARAGHPFPPGYPPGPTASGFVPGAGNPTPATGPTGYAPPPPGYAPPAWGPVPPAPPLPPNVELQHARREPIGAILLILLGMLFLFNTLGLLSFSWIGHGWPWVIVAIAVWLLVRGGGARFHLHAPPPPQEPAQPQPPAGGGQ